MYDSVKSKNNNYNYPLVVQFSSAISSWVQGARATVTFLSSKAFRFMADMKMYIRVQGNAEI